MYMGKIAWIVALLIVVLLAAAGAFWFVQHSVQPSGGPNPNEVPGLVPHSDDAATVFCGTLGGTVTSGMCNLPNGKKCQAQKFYETNECVSG